MQGSRLLLAAAMLFPPLASNAPRRPEVLIQPYEQMMLQGTVTSGEVVQGAILSDCVPARMTQFFDDHRDDFLTLACSNGKINIQIDNILFDTTEKVPVHVVEVMKAKNGK